MTRSALAVVGLCASFWLALILGIALDKRFGKLFYFDGL